ncbi:hypothetical protein LTR78_004322 [Recurvomyces mirabilis]|uniref:Uncharacterized protein n=1 Tax=Recurvomyces mirabilis TaxID=574656 RepID=A0AAE0WPP5_9PEZI|nr:hypothetical protein LTR78_004322 [Recurvomyces mirabilis]
MCFQGFVYFACGHNRIVTHDCEHALVAGNPHYIRHQCPDYNSSSERPNFQCGLGKYYCSESVDGPFLDHVHQAATTAQSNISIIDTQLVNLGNTRGQLIAEAKFRGMSDEALMHSKEHQWLVAKRGEWTVERNRQQITQIDATAITQQALRYYKDMRPRYGDFSNAGPRAPFIPGQTVFGTFVAGAPTAQNSTSGQPCWGTEMSKQQPYTVTGQYSQLPSPARTHLAATPGYTTASTTYPPVVPSRVTGETISALADNVRVAQQAEMARQRNMSPVANQDRKVGRQRGAMSARPQKSRATQARAAEHDSAEEEIEVVRRSARVRNKKVNYAEDGCSSIASREPSPAKSDRSAFSPLMSDASSTAEKDCIGATTSAKKPCETPRTLSRPASSLNDKITDWSKRSNVRETSTSDGRRTMPDMKDILNSSPASEVFASNRTVGQSENHRQARGYTFKEPINTSKKPEALALALNSTPQPLEKHQIFPPITMAAQQDQVGILTPAPILARPKSHHAAFDVGSYVPLFRPQQPLLREPSSGTAMPTSVWDQASPVTSTQLHRGPSLPYQAFTVHTDSITGLGKEENGEHEVDVNSYYGSLRRSFGSGTPLAPTKLFDGAQSDRDPKKRLSSTLTETEKPRKRMRLSLPGQEAQPAAQPAPNWLLGQGLIMNTDGRGAPLYAPLITQGQVRMQGNNSPSSLGAPFEPPTAIMTATTAPSDEGLDGVASSASPPGQKAEQASAENDTAESGPDFSDIDWGHHEHDLDAFVD